MRRLVVPAAVGRLLRRCRLWLYGGCLADRLTRPIPDYPHELLQLCDVARAGARVDSMKAWEEGDW